MIVPSHLGQPSWLPLKAIWLLVVVLCADQVRAFGRGSAIVRGPVVMRSLYCGREPLHRAPFHIDGQRCGGYCSASLNTQGKFTVSVSTNRYWNNDITVKVNSVAGSSLQLTGFAINAINDEGTVVGHFKPHDDITIGVCNKGKEVEGDTVFHAQADHTRTSLNLTWTAPKKNYNDIKFRIWAVHNFSAIFYLESEPIHSRKNGSVGLNLTATLLRLLGLRGRCAGDRVQQLFNAFDDNFQVRLKAGYATDTKDPFRRLRRLPRPHDLIPDPGDREVLAADVSCPDNTYSLNDGSQSSLPGGTNGEDESPTAGKRDGRGTSTNTTLNGDEDSTGSPAAPQGDELISGEAADTDLPLSLSDSQPTPAQPTNPTVIAVAISLSDSKPDISVKAPYAEATSTARIANKPIVIQGSPLQPTEDFQTGFQGTSDSPGQTDFRVQLVPSQQAVQQFGSSQFGGTLLSSSQIGGSQFGSPQFGGLQFGSSQFARSQSGSSQLEGSQFGSPQSGGPQFGSSQLEGSVW